MAAAVLALKADFANLHFKPTIKECSRFTPEILPRVQHHHMEKMRRHEHIVVSHVQSWMDASFAPNANEILKMFACIKRLVRLMDYSFSRILYPMLIYAQQFVKRTGPVAPTGLFPLLVVAACLALKMWEDYGPDLDLTAEVCNISKKQLSTLEREFLHQLNFRLLLHDSDIDSFKASPIRAVAGCA
eukprot:TRINITY_DN9434_c0_g1_i2.p1 TRINITY_DN9434_c0_g1~~TRINITY_DN9434_c0_g1_i2.p1  ORF type:complete len:187 (+),score=59.78 TRINITY_DN9434_c0_g1_i2:107-667(+)